MFLIQLKDLKIVWNDATFLEVLARTWKWTKTEDVNIWGIWDDSSFWRIYPEVERPRGNVWKAEKAFENDPPYSGNDEIMTTLSKLLPQLENVLVS